MPSVSVSKVPHGRDETRRWGQRSCLMLNCCRMYFKLDFLLLQRYKKSVRRTANKIIQITPSAMIRWWPTQPNRNIRLVQNIKFFWISWWLQSKFTSRFTHQSKRFVASTVDFLLNKKLIRPICPLKECTIELLCESTEKKLNLLVQWAKLLPEFNEFPLEDQVCLLKASE